MSSINISSREVVFVQESDNITFFPIKYKVEMIRLTQNTTFVQTPFIKEKVKRIRMNNLKIFDRDGRIFPLYRVDSDK